MSSIAEKISRAEQRWYNLLHNHIVGLYTNFHIPSHDVEHHVRVWNHCKILIVELSKAKVHFDESTIVKLLVACMFHDTGLIEDSSERHGYQSRRFCEQFFAENNGFTVNNLEEVLSAIEFHDDKSLKEFSSSDRDSFSIHKLVSAADDLDAFGYIGVFRYLEIYLIRGIPLNELPLKVMENLTNRFFNFEQGFLLIPNCVEFHRVQYNISHNFFKNLSVQLKNECGELNNEHRVSKILHNCLIEKRMNIHQTIQLALNQNKGNFAEKFFNGLKNEINAK